MWLFKCPSGTSRGSKKGKNYLEQFVFVQGQREAFYSWFIAILVPFKLSFMSKVLSCLQIIRKHSAASCLPKFLQGRGLWSWIPFAIWLKIGGCWDKLGSSQWGKGLSFPFIIIFFKFPTLLSCFQHGNAGSQHRGMVCGN